MHSIHLKEFDHANYTINVMYVFINLIADYLFSKFQIMALSQLIRIIELGKKCNRVSRKLFYSQSIVLKITIAKLLPDKLLQYISMMHNTIHQ